MLQVKIKLIIITVMIFNLGWFSVFFVFWGKETKGIKNQPRLKQN